MNQSGKRTEKAKSPTLLTRLERVIIILTAPFCSASLCTDHQSKFWNHASLQSLLRFCGRAFVSGFVSHQLVPWRLQTSSIICFYYQANTTTPSTTFGFWIHSSPTRPHHSHKSHENIAFWSCSDILLISKFNQSPQQKCSPNTQSPPSWLPLWLLVRFNSLYFERRRK